MMCQVRAHMCDSEVQIRPGVPRWWREIVPRWWREVGFCSIVQGIETLGAAGPYFVASCDQQSIAFLGKGKTQVQLLIWPHTPGVGKRCCFY